MLNDLRDIKWGEKIKRIPAKKYPVVSQISENVGLRHCSSNLQSIKIPMYRDAPSAHPFHLFDFQSQPNQWDKGRFWEIAENLNTASRLHF